MGIDIDIDIDKAIPKISISISISIRQFCKISISIKYRIDSNLAYRTGLGVALITRLGWTFSQGSETKERPNHAPCCWQHFIKSLTQLGLGNLLVQFAADLQFWKYESQRSSDLSLS